MINGDTACMLACGCDNEEGHLLGSPYQRFSVIMVPRFHPCLAPVSVLLRALLEARNQYRSHPALHQVINTGKTSLGNTSTAVLPMFGPRSALLRAFHGS